MSEVTHYQNIFDYIIAMESLYKKPIPINEKWNWSMKDHILTSEMYKNSQLLSGKSDFKPVKNITRPILNLQHRTEDIEVKDVQLYADDPENYHLSFLVKKYHDDVFVVDNDIDSFFDALNESRIDFGAGLSKQLNKPCPEVVPLQSIAFCDQSDMLSAPIGLEHFYSPDQLKDMESKGWGKKGNGATISVDDLINLSRAERKKQGADDVTETPGRYIKVYEVHGNLPKRFADSADTSNSYETRIFIVAFYQSKESQTKQGVILYTALENESPFKLVKRDPVFGRTLGFGGAEELFEAQVWTNYDMIRKQDLLDAASKVLLKTTDPAVATRNQVRDLSNLEVIELAPNTDISQIDTFPRNIQLFEKSVAEWQSHAEDMGGAQDPLQGAESASGTPFAAIQAQIQQGMGLHDYRRGQYAKHLEEIYRDWIIPHIEKEICKGTTFLSELSFEDLQSVTDSIVECETQKMQKDFILSHGGEAPTPEMTASFKDGVRSTLQKKGNKFFVEILKNEFKSIPIGVKVSIAGKSKNLGKAADALSNIFRTAFSNPQGFAQVMQIPGMAKSFNQLLEYSGLDPADFSGIDKLAQAQQQPQTSQQPIQGQPSPIQMKQPQSAAY